MILNAKSSPLTKDPAMWYSVWTGGSMQEKKLYEHILFKRLVMTHLKPPEWMISGDGYFVNVTTSGNFYKVSAAPNKDLAFRIAKDGKASKVPIGGAAGGMNVSTAQMVADLGIKLDAEAEVLEKPTDGEVV
jgi:hypothetical protein